MEKELQKSQTSRVQRSLGQEEWLRDAHSYVLLVETFALIAKLKLIWVCFGDAKPKIGFYTNSISRTPYPTVNWKKMNI